MESINYWQKQLKTIDESAMTSRPVDYGAKIDLQSTLFHLLNLSPDFTIQVTYNNNKKDLESSLVVVNNDDVPLAINDYTISKMRNGSDISIEIITNKPFSYDDWDLLSLSVEKVLRKMFGPGFDKLHNDEPFMIPYTDKNGRTWYIAFISFIG